MDFLRSDHAVLAAQMRGARVVITGAGSGMGREMAILAARHGAAVVATCGIVEADVAETSALCREAATAPGFAAEHAAVDVTSRAQLQAWADGYRGRHKQADYIVANAGVAGGNGLLDTEAELYDKILAVNLGGVIDFVRCFIPLVIEGSGARRRAVVVMSSLCGYFACMGPEQPNQPYGVSKFAVRGFAESLMVELRSAAPAVSVLAVFPGQVGTDILRTSAAPKVQAPHYLNSFLRAQRVLKYAGIEAATPQEVRVEVGKLFKAYAPCTAAEAAEAILSSAVRGRTRLILGADAKFVEVGVRLMPAWVYSRLFFVAWVSFCGARGAAIAVSRRIGGGGGAVGLCALVAGLVAFAAWAAAMPVPEVFAGLFFAR